METSSAFLRHESCPKCKSKDNLARYTDGHAYCFGCHHYEHGDGSLVNEPRRLTMKDMVEFDVAPLPKRGINEDTCKKWHYGVGKYNGTPVQIANYCDDDGKAVAQKLRFPTRTLCGWARQTRLGSGASTCGVTVARWSRLLRVRSMP